MKEKGFIPVMLTPFKQNGEIDFEGLTRLTEYYLEAGAAGLFANCLSSEMFELSEAERLQIVRHVRIVANGAVPVVATGTFGGEMDKQAVFVKQIYDQGVDAVILITGLLAPEGSSDQLFEANLNELMHKTEKIPLGFYECPVPYKKILTPEQLGRFAATGRIIYHKDTCLNLDEVRAKNENCAQYADFGLYDAYMAHAVDSLKSGSAGLSCIQGNFFPELVVWLCQNYNRTDLRNEVSIVQQFFIDEMEIVHWHYPAVAKFYLQQRGMGFSPTVRRGHEVQLSSDERKGILDLGKRYDVMLDSLGIACKT